MIAGLPGVVVRVRLGPFEATSARIAVARVAGAGQPGEAFAHNRF